jgi:hypothetical protein
MVVSMDNGNNRSFVKLFKPFNRFASFNVEIAQNKHQTRSNEEA